MGNLNEATVATIFLHLAEFLRKTGKLNIFDTLVYNYRLKELLPQKSLQDFSTDLHDLIRTLQNLLNQSKNQSGLINNFGTGITATQILKPSENSVEINWDGSSLRRQKQNNRHNNKPKKRHNTQTKTSNSVLISEPIPPVPLQAQEISLSSVDGIFCCSDCFKVFKSKASFLSHFSTKKKHLQNPEKFLLTNSQEISKLKRFICGICLQEMRTYERIASHLPKCESGPYHCEICSKKSDDESEEAEAFESMKLLNRHKHMVHSDSKSFICNECDLAFRYKQSLVKHKRRRHEVQTFPCTSCNEVFNRRITLTNHKIRYHRAVTNICHQCGVSCSNDAALITHITLKHNPQAPVSQLKKFICNYCSKEFPRKDKLNFHLTIHTGEKSFTCSTCGKGFSRKSKLDDHEARHLGLKKYVCQHPNCFKSYASNVDLKIHFKNHHSSDHQPNKSDPAASKRKRKKKPRQKENQGTLPVPIPDILPSETLLFDEVNEEIASFPNEIPILPPPEPTIQGENLHNQFDLGAGTGSTEHSEIIGSCGEGYDEFSYQPEQNWTETTEVSLPLNSNSYNGNNYGPGQFLPEPIRETDYYQNYYYPIDNSHDNSYQHQQEHYNFHPNTNNRISNNEVLVHDQLNTSLHINPSGYDSLTSTQQQDTNFSQNYFGHSAIGTEYQVYQYQEGSFQFQQGYTTMRNIPGSESEFPIGVSYRTLATSSSTFVTSNNGNSSVGFHGNNINNY